VATDEVTAVYVPTAPQQFRLPRLPRLAFAASTVGVAVLIWGFLSFSVAGNESGNSERFTLSDPAETRAFAFIDHSGAESQLVIFDPASMAATRTVASFERINGGAVFGAMSPDATSAAVVHPAPHGGGLLSIVRLGSGEVLTSPAIVDGNTALAWSPRGEAVVAVTSTPADATGRLSASLLVVDALTGATTTTTTFPSAFQVVPIGFARDGESVLAVVIDQAGSALWSVTDGRQTMVAQLSSGRTRDWALNPDRSMLAFIELRVGGDVPAIGRVVLTSDGSSAATLDEFASFEGAAWRAGSSVASFGGPGGNVTVDGNSTGHGYLVPAAWSPDGESLIARVVSPGPGGETSTESWQLIPASGGTPEHSRTVLYEQADSASFLGWARTSLASMTTTAGAGTWR